MDIDQVHLKLQSLTLLNEFQVQISKTLSIKTIDCLRDVNVTLTFRKQVLELDYAKQAHTVSSDFSERALRYRN